MMREFLTEYAATIGLDVFKDKLSEKMDHEKLKKLIEKFLEREKDRNYNSTLVEEIDFEGFCNYARSNMIEDIQNYIFSDSKDQEMFERNIINKAIHYAQANNQISEQKVTSMTRALMGILYRFYRSFRTTKGTLLLAGEIERQLDGMLGEIMSAIDGSHNDINTTMTAEHTDTRKKLEQIKEEFAEYATRKQKKLSSQINSYIDAKREAVLDYAIFPWFKDSPRYRAVFPQLFVDPVFRSGNGLVFLNEVCSHIDRHIVILGEAGAGKSTLLRYLFAFSKFENRKCLYITAREAKAENGILDKIAENSSVDNTEQYLVCVDGIDEEFAYDYAGFCSFILKLQTFSNVKFWLGCRTDYFLRNYNEDFSFVRHSFTIEPWLPNQSDYFIEQYAQITENAKLKDCVDELVENYEVLQGFKSNPFQLSLLLFLAEGKEDSPILGVYDLYERFIFRWIEREKKRRTSSAAEKELLKLLVSAATRIYSAEDYLLDDIALNNSAVRNLLIIQQKSGLSYTCYASAFYHRSLATFLLAHGLIEAFLNNDQIQIRSFFNIKLKDDVTNFVGNKFATLTEAEKQTIKETLIRLYADTDASEIRIKEQIVYYITRLGIDVTEFLMDIIKKAPEDPIMRLTIAYGSVLSEDPDVRAFALDYARSLSMDSEDARTNRAWTLIYFGDVNDRNPYTYVDDEQRQWQNARKARIKRFTKKNPRLKDYRFRLFDIPLFHSFLKDRNWNDISFEEYDILDNVNFPESIFNPGEIQFLNEEKAKLLNEYRNQLEKTMCDV